MIFPLDDEIDVVPFSTSVASLGEGLGATGTFKVDGSDSNAVIADLVVGLGGAGFMIITGGGLVDQRVGADPQCASRRE